MIVFLIGNFPFVFVEMKEQIWLKWRKSPHETWFYVWMLDGKLEKDVCMKSTDTKMIKTNKKWFADSVADGVRYNNLIRLWLRAVSWIRRGDVSELRIDWILKFWFFSFHPLNKSVYGINGIIRMKRALPRIHSIHLYFILLRVSVDIIYGNLKITIFVLCWIAVQ